jgi:hypothetical protein
MMFDYFWKKYDGRGRVCARCSQFRVYGWRAIGFPKRLMPFVCIQCRPRRPE